MPVCLARSWLAVLGVASLVAISAACGDDDDEGGATATTTGELGAATTAIDVVVPTPPRYVRGTDGRIHLEYDLITTAVMSAPVSLTSLVVRDGETELTRLDTEALQAVTFQFLSPTPTLDIAPSTAVMTVVDVVLPTDDYADVPEEVTNEIAYTFADDAPFRTIIRTLTANGPPIDVPRYEPIVIEPPLRGDGWLSFNACCTPTAHRTFLLASDATLHAVEMFAIDWIRFVDGEAAEGDASQVSDFYGYGQTIYSATDGEVVHVRNDLADAPLNESLGGNDTVTAPDDYGGNGVVVKIDDGQYALYAHMIAGSVIPEVGDEVEAGDPLGELGSSGNATVPHLHFGIQETADAFASNSVPYVIGSYTLTGTGTFSADGELTVTPVNTLQEETLPLVNDIADFGE